MSADTATATDSSAGNRERPSWKGAIEPYERADWSRAVLDLLTSVVPYLGVSALIYLSLDVSIWLTLGLAIPAAGFLLRTFIVFHDCGHGSFTPSSRANLWIGRFSGLLVLAPFANWRHDHAVHHGTAGDLDRRGVGDVPTLTVAEYRAKPFLGRLGYRLFRNPLVMFGIGPIFSMIVAPRLSSRAKRRRLRNSIIATNVALAVVIGSLCLLIGWQEFLLVWGPSAFLAGMAGVWLFYVQHQFEDVYWESSERWSYGDAALRGSSYLRMPKPLQFFTGNIGLHHVHHLSAKVPNYNLQRAHDENEIFATVPVLTIPEGLRAVRLKLIDEQTGRLVTWSEARVSGVASAAPAGS